MFRLRSFLSAVCASLCLMGAGSASAALFDRGGGLIYDSALNVTWLQDANYAKTSGYDGDGSMNWITANTWAANLIFHDSVRNVDYTDWRLPKINAQFGFNLNCTSYDGSSDCGFNISNSNNEIAHLFYVSLSNSGSYDTQGNVNLPHTLNSGLFKNLQISRYWTGTQLPPPELGRGKPLHLKLAPA